MGGQKQQHAMALPEELVEEILLRLPAAEPACLFRAAVICKPCRHLILETRFGRRYRDFHRSPPTLGFLCNAKCDAGYMARLVPAAPTLRLPRRTADDCNGRQWRALGVCHGRALLHDADLVDMPSPFIKGFVVWEPVTDHREELPLPVSPLEHQIVLLHRNCWRAYRARFRLHSWNAAFVCAAAGLGGTSNCDHLGCHGRPFLVVLVVNTTTPTTTESGEMCTYVYSSEAGEWGPPTEHTRLPFHYVGVTPDPSVIVGNALYFLSQRNKCIFVYDLGRRKMFVFLLPNNYSLGRIVLMAMEDGRLGLATIDCSKLYLWSREAGRVGAGSAAWTVSRVIDLKALLPGIGEPNQSFVVGCAGSAAVIFVFVDGGIFSVDINSSQITEVCRASWPVDVFPYHSFCTPGPSVSFF